MVEQRTYERREIGSLDVVAGGSVRCVLLDLSLAGARLSSEGYLPEKFYLMLRPDLKRWCQVIWRRRGQVGVRFIKDPVSRGQFAQVEPGYWSISVSKARAALSSRRGLRPLSR